MPAPDRSIESMERLFAALRTYHALCPDLRVGQMIGNAMAGRGRTHFDPYLLENDWLTKAVEAEVVRVTVARSSQ